MLCVAGVICGSGASAEHAGEVALPLPRPDRLAALPLPNPVLRRAVSAHSKSNQAADFVRNERIPVRSGCYLVSFPLSRLAMRLRFLVS